MKIKEIFNEVLEYLDKCNEKLNIDHSLDGLIFSVGNKKWINHNNDYYSLYENKQLSLLINRYCNTTNFSHKELEAALNNKKFRHHLKLKAFW